MLAQTEITDDQKYLAARLNREATGSCLTRPVLERMNLKFGTSLVTEKLRHMHGECTVSSPRSYLESILREDTHD